jgi:hypothetical protein
MVEAIGSANPAKEWSQDCNEYGRLDFVLTYGGELVNSGCGNPAARKLSGS